MTTRNEIEKMEDIVNSENPEDAFSATASTKKKAIAKCGVPVIGAVRRKKLGKIRSLLWRGIRNRVKSLGRIIIQTLLIDQQGHK